jgi:hypothetical protein
MDTFSHRQSGALLGQTFRDTLRRMRKRSADSTLVAMNGDDALASLVGGHLDTVSFVMGYVEFRVNYNILRALSSPRVQLPDGDTYQFPDPGSRDALCSMIDTRIVVARLQGSETADDFRIELQTDSGHRLTVPLDDSSRVGVEAAHLIPADETGRSDGSNMWIW